MTKILLGCLALALSVWAYTFFNHPLASQTSYADISLDMTKSDVRTVKGVPVYVLEDLPGGQDAPPNVFQTVITTTQIEHGKSFLDYNYWGYEENFPLNTNAKSITVVFDTSTGTVRRISCSAGNDRCDPILGIDTNSSEEDVIKHLGNPDQAELTGVTKTLHYPKLNLSVLVTQNKVYKLVLEKTAAATH